MVVFNSRKVVVAETEQDIQIVISCIDSLLCISGDSTTPKMVQNVS